MSHFINSRLRLRYLKYLLLVIVIYGCIYTILHLNVLNWESYVHVQVQMSKKYNSLVNPTLIQKTDQLEIPEPELKEVDQPQISTNVYSETFPPRTESDFSYYLSTRRLLLLTIQHMNSKLDEFKSIWQEHQNVTSTSKFPCANWWANPVNVIQHEIYNSTKEIDTHVIEFEAETEYERNDFQAVIEINIKSQPNAINIISIKSLNKFRARLRKRDGINCTVMLPEIPNTPQVDELCSCELPVKQGYDNLYSWPVNSSFFPGDYLNNYTDFKDMFNILPENGSTRYCNENPDGTRDGIKLIVLVSSAPIHFPHRQTIRATYGSKENLQQNNAELIFFFGKVSDKILHNKLANEAEMYQDIVQVNYLDGYHNLTLSHLSMYSYIYHICSGKNSLDPNDTNFNAPKYALKVDDDFLQNLPVVNRIAKANPDVELIGCLYCGTSPVLDPTYMTKYYTPRYMHLGKHYPGYLSGVSYLLRTDIIPKFLQASLTVPFVHMDDTYVTGFLPAFLKIYPRMSKRFGYGRVDPKPENVCEIGKMANSFALGFEDMKKQWQLMKFYEQKQHNCLPGTESDLKVQKITPAFIKACRYEL